MNQTVSYGMLVVGAIMFFVGMGILQGRIKSMGGFFLGFILFAVGISLAAGAVAGLSDKSTTRQHDPPGYLNCRPSEDGCSLVTPPTNS